MKFDEFSKLTLLQLVLALTDCDELTVKEHRGLPSIAKAVPANDYWCNERRLGAMTVGETEQLLAMGRRYLLMQIPPPAYPTTITTIPQNPVQIKLPQIGD